MQEVRIDRKLNSGHALVLVLPSAGGFGLTSLRHLSGFEPVLQSNFPKLEIVDDRLAVNFLISCFQFECLK